jgi:hypothetical protein
MAGAAYLFVSGIPAQEVREFLERPLVDLTAFEAFIWVVAVSWFLRK